MTIRRAAGLVFAPAGDTQRRARGVVPPAKVFDEAALKAVSQWRLEGSGKSVTTTRTVNFSPADQG